MRLFSLLMFAFMLTLLFAGDASARCGRGAGSGWFKNRPHRLRTWFQQRPHRLRHRCD